MKWGLYAVSQSQITMNFLKLTEAKFTGLLGGLTFISVSLFSGANPAQAARLGPGRLDVTSLPRGFVVYTGNALDFTSGVDADGIPIPSPSPTPGIVSGDKTDPTGPDGFGIAAGSGSLAGATDPFIADQFSPIPIPELPADSLPVPNNELILFTLPDSGEALFSFDSVVRDPGDLTVDLVFTGLITDVAGNDFDPTRATFAVLTGQVPFDISDTPVLDSLDDIEILTDANGDNNFTSWSATVIVGEQIPEPSSVLSVFLVLGSCGLLKRNRNIKKNPTS